MADSIDDLEAQAALHRAGLAAALGGLIQGAQPAALAGSDLAQNAASVLFDKTVSTARENPLASALVGLGLALILTNGKKAPAPQPQSPAPQSAETMRETLHTGLEHLPPEARKRVIRKRIEALEAQEKVEKHPQTPLAAMREHKLSLLIAAAGMAFALHRMWPKKAQDDRATRDALIRAADTQLAVEEARLQPFPGGPTPTHEYHNQDRI